MIRKFEQELEYEVRAGNRKRTWIELIGDRCCNSESMDTKYKRLVITTFIPNTQSISNLTKFIQQNINIHDSNISCFIKVTFKIYLFSDINFACSISVNTYGHTGFLVVHGER